MVLRPQSPQSRSQQLADRKAVQDEAFFREVDDAVRQDEVSVAVRRYAVPGAIAIVLALAALAGFLWWQHQRALATDHRGEDLIKVLDNVEAGRLDDADAGLNALASGPDGGSSAVARIARAGIAARQGRTAEAAKQFTAVADDAGAPRALRDLATVRAVAIGFDTLAPERIVARLKPLVVPGGAWFGSAGELLGAAYLRQGQTALAGPLFAAIARDTQSPTSLRRRARQLAGLLGVDAVDDVARSTIEGQPDAAR